MFKAKTKIPEIDCDHNWQKNKGLDSKPCLFCDWYPATNKRSKCNLCFNEACISCVEKYTDFKFQEVHSLKNFQINENTFDRITRLEQRVANIEKEIFYKNKEKIEEDTEENINLANLEQKIKFCNQDKKLNSIKLEVTFKHHNKIIGTNEIIDIGCTTIIVDPKLIDTSKILKFKDPIKATQMDGSINEYNYYAKNCNIAFLNNCNNYSQYYFMPYVLIKEILEKHGVGIIIGLKFLLDLDG
ncbi:hypothetical protein ACH5RR_035076 [Cinchona calisaya]|uniref:Peptidase A3B domain-containing protein n=1 Tax=Cinchona calisaya TaxID=153742 RepID=A0ABD2YD58_9GENT